MQHIRQALYRLTPDAERHAAMLAERVPLLRTFVSTSPLVDLAIDLGTANTLVFQEGKGIVYDEPSVVAMDAREGDVLAIGEEAWEMIGRTPSRIVAVRPLRRGAITDYDVTSQMIRLIFRRVGVTRFARPKSLICVPSAITEVERRAVEEATTAAGARSVALIEEPMAAAIGAGLPITEPSGNMVVDIGGGTTEVAVISLGGIVVARSIRIGGDEMDTDIVSFARREYNLLMGERTAEEIKIAIGSAFPLPNEPNAEIRGRDLVSGLPKTIVVSAEELRKAIEEPVNACVDAVKNTLDKAPPELAADIMDRGIMMTGGGALLQGLDERLRHETGMPVHLTENPLTSVAIGSGRCLEEFEALKKVLITSSN
jgi:rod shape-determining protein MreB and related proteins